MKVQALTLSLVVIGGAVAGIAVFAATNDGNGRDMSKYEKVAANTGEKPEDIMDLDDMRSHLKKEAEVDPEDWSVLEEHLKSEAPDTRWRAINTMKNTTDPEDQERARELLVEVFENDAELTLRSSAMVAYCSLKGPRCEEMIATAQEKGFPERDIDRAQGFLASANQ